MERDLLLDMPLMQRVCDNKLTGDNIVDARTERAAKFVSYAGGKVMMWFK